MSDSDDSASSIDSGQSRSERLTDRQRTKSTSKKRKRRSNRSSSKKLKTPGPSDTASDVSDGSGRNQHSAARAERDALAAALAQNAAEINEVKTRLGILEKQIHKERETGEESAFFKSLLDEKHNLLEKENKLRDEKNILLDEKRTAARSTRAVEITTTLGTFTLRGVTKSKYPLWDRMAEVKLEEIGNTQPAIGLTLASAGAELHADVCVNSADGVERDDQITEDEEAEGEAVSLGRMLLMTVPTRLLYWERHSTHLALDSTRLVIRSEAIKAANVVMGYLQRRMDAQLAIIGIPGIGKTLLSNYLLKLCWDANIPVLLHDLKENMLLLLRRDQPTLEVSEEIKERKRIFEALSDQPTLYLCDTGVHTTRGPHTFDFSGVTVMTTSPDSRHFGQWARPGVRFLWLPPWSKAELQRALPHLLVDPSEANLAAVMERYEAVGGTLRVLKSTENAFAAYVKEAEDKVSVLEPKELLALMKEFKSSGGSKLDAETRKISHQVLHVWPTPIDEDTADSKRYDQTLVVRFASDRLPELVTQAWSGSAADVVAHSITQLSQSSQCSSAAGNLYEDLFYSRLRGSFTASIWTAVPDSGTAEHSSLAAQLVKSAQSPREEALDKTEVQLNVGVYLSLKGGPVGPVVPCAGLLVRARKGFPGIDGWLYVELADGEREIWLLQNTMAASHDINQGMRQGVDLARVHDWADAPYRLVFVVPETRVSAYCTQRQRAIRVTDEDRNACAHRSIGRKPALVWKMDVVDLMRIGKGDEKGSDDVLGKDGEKGSDDVLGKGDEKGSDDVLGKDGEKGSDDVQTPHASDALPRRTVLHSEPGCRSPCKDSLSTAGRGDKEPRGNHDRA